MDMPNMEVKKKEETVVVPPVQDFNTLAETIKENGLQDDDQAFFAESQLVHIKRLSKEIEDHHNEAIGKANDAHKSMIAARNKVLDPVKEAELLIKKAVGEYGLKKHAKGVSVKTKIKAEIFDVDSIPDSFLELKPNIKAIEAVLNAGGTVEGVKPIKTQTVTVRA